MILVATVAFSVGFSAGVFATWKVIHLIESVLGEGFHVSTKTREMEEREKLEAAMKRGAVISSPGAQVFTLPRRR